VGKRTGNATVKRRASVLLFQIMEPDDQIIAGAQVVIGSPMWVDLVYASRVFILVTWAISKVVTRPAYVAVTRQRLIFLDVPRGKVLVDVPRSVVAAEHWHPEFVETIAVLRAGDPDRNL
jgi:hypothetical protein